MAELTVNFGTMAHQYLLTPCFLDKEKNELNRISEKSWQVNKPVISGSTAADRIKTVHNSLERQLSHILQEGQVPVSMGGDCCMAIPVLAALQKNGLSPWILWLDAHGDFNTDETTMSGFLPGMALSMLTGRGDQQFMDNIEARKVADNDIVLTDGRDLDPAEKELLEQSRVNWLKNVRDVKRFNFNNRPIYIHFDVDVLHAQDIPATLYPVASGPRVAEMADLFKYLQQTQTVCAVSVTCWEPQLDKDNKTEKTIKELLGSLLG